ncbi:MAG: rod shape-determining protein [Muribaculaceae bacterium]|nr:rod shape-determining protein [Muribaculaceae bacterium]MDY3932288.1 rod shape-determining protein [Muribaculaceae bacterium]
MGWFSFTQEIAVDLGTANTIIMHNDKIVVDQPSIIARDAKTEKLIAVGERAREMQGKENPNIQTIRPLKDGVIADFTAAELMIRGLVKMVSSKNHWFSPSLRMVVCIPSGSTEVEIRAVRDSSDRAGGRDVYMIKEPIAAALGIGLDVLAPEGNMIVDIGGGSTEIAVISLGGIVTDKSIRVAGDDLTEDIMEYMRRAHNVKVGERMAETIKINVGSALTELENPPEDYVVHGPNLMTALPMEIPVSYQEISHCIEKSISKIEAAVLGALENTPPELYADIVKNGVYLTGGGALLRGLDKRLTDKIGIQFHIADDPLHSVAKGTGVALKNIGKFSFLIR